MKFAMLSIKTGKTIMHENATQAQLTELYLSFLWSGSGEGQRLQLSSVFFFETTMIISMERSLWQNLRRKR
jgi:hypothetical protein